MKDKQEQYIQQYLSIEFDLPQVKIPDGIVILPVFEFEGYTIDTRTMKVYNSKGKELTQTFVCGRARVQFSRNGKRHSRYVDLLTLRALYQDEKLRLRY
jgi:hypothetical protein